MSPPGLLWPPAGCKDDLLISLALPLETPCKNCILGVRVRSHMPPAVWRTLFSYIMKATSSVLRGCRPLKEKKKIFIYLII